MNLDYFDYNLPEELIAMIPLKKRDSSKLLILDRISGNIKHGVFSDIKDYFNKGDCLVLNNTRVIPARLLGEKDGTKGKIEFVLLNQTDKDIWEVILKPGKRAKIGTRFNFGGGILKAEIIKILEEGNRLVKFYYEGIFEEVLDKVGIMPLPPYITSELEDRERYQTVYSKEKGSAAAPTAGLHFTDELLDEIKNIGVNICFVTLHVGLGTFRPVKVSNIFDHKMHKEYYSVNEETVKIINMAKLNKNKVIAVGTTSARVLETMSCNKEFKHGSGWTDIFIYPGYEFKIVDKLITNFHLPKSTLLMLVSALAGRDNVLSAYNEAILNRYRFFSFGDAMFII